MSQDVYYPSSTFLTPSLLIYFPEITWAKEGKVETTKELTIDLVFKFRRDTVPSKVQILLCFVCLLYINKTNCIKFLKVSFCLSQSSVLRPNNLSSKSPLPLRMYTDLLLGYYI